MQHVSVDKKSDKSVHQNIIKTNLMQRECACGGSCAKCSDDDKKLMRRSTGGTAVNSVPPSVHTVLRSSGQPLDATTRSFVEPRFGHDFSNVRVYTDARASESAIAVHALAYTVGQNVVFREGQYHPRTTTGMQLLAHELTHVVQQSGTQTMHSKLDQLQPVSDSRLEQEADRFAQKITSADFASLDVGGNASVGALQKQDDPSTPTAASSTVYLCSKKLLSAPLAKHAFFRVGGSGKGNSTYSLEPVDRGNDCWQGQPMYDYPEDFNADAECEATTLNQTCLQRELVGYPIGQYCTFGPNSNTFVGHLARQCGMSNPAPPGWTPGISDRPPIARTFAPSPNNTFFLGCSFKNCDASRDDPPGEVPV